MPCNLIANDRPDISRHIPGYPVTFPSVIPCPFSFVMFPEVRAALVELQQAFPLLEIFLYDGEDSVLHCDKLRQLDSSARHTVDILLAPARLRYDHGG